LRILLAVLLPLAVAAAGCRGSGGGEEFCRGVKIAVMAPISGTSASIGGDQLDFATLAVEDFNRQHHAHYGLEEVDTGGIPTVAGLAARRVVGEADVLGVLGPAGNQEVESAGLVYRDAHLVFVSASATATHLTVDGDFPTFFRVVPNDSAQGPTDATFIARTLRARTAWVVDDGSSYSTGLAQSAAERLRREGVAVERASAPEGADISKVVGRAKEGDAVFLPWQVDSQAEAFGRELAARGSHAVIVASDGLFGTHFSVRGSYLSWFAPDVKQIPSSRELVKAYESKYGDVGSTYGPPTYAAANVLLTAIDRACREARRRPSRLQVVEAMRRVHLESSILGVPIAFDRKGDLVGAKFAIFEVLGDGRYRLESG
jgi:branched-chain amino acid transport system substrate-binding protein